MELFIRTIGIARATTKIGLANLVFNIKRLPFLRRRDPQRQAPGQRAALLLEAEGRHQRDRTVHALRRRPVLQRQLQTQRQQRPKKLEWNAAVMAGTVRHLTRARVSA